MKKITSILITLVCTAILFSSCGHKAPKVGDIRNIFPEEMGSDNDLPNDTANLIVDYDNSIFNADVNIYYGVSKFSSKYENSIIEKFGLEKSDSESAFYGTNWNCYKNNRSEVTIDRRDGTFLFNEKQNVSGIINDRDRFDKLGEQKLKELNLLPENYCLNGYSLSGREENPNEYGPIFAQQIDGKKVMGVGNVSIRFNSSEEITQIDCNWLDPIYAAKAKTLSFEEAYAKIGGDDSYITTEVSTPLTKVEFDTVNAVYYKNPEYDYYVPMFRCEGTAWSGDRSDVIWAYVIAIPDLTDDMIQK